jgi:hypothetical protein
MRANTSALFFVFDSFDFLFFFVLVNCSARIVFYGRCVATAAALAGFLALGMVLHAGFYPPIKQMDAATWPPIAEARPGTLSSISEPGVILMGLSVMSLGLVLWQKIRHGFAIPPEA